MAAIICPACNKTGLASDTCPRCGCDLAYLHQIDRAAARLLRSAVQSLCARQWREALRQADRAWSLRHSAVAARVAFLAAGSLGMTGQAMRWRSLGTTLRQGLFEESATRPRRPGP